MIDVGTLFSSSWTRFSKNIGMGIGLYLVGMIAAGFLGGLTLGIVAVPVYAGVYKAFRKMQRGETPDFNDLFSEFSNFSQWLMLWVAGIVIGVACFIVIGLLFLLAMIPVIGLLFLLLGWLAAVVLGIALGVSLFFVIPLMLEQRMAAFDAVKASFGKIKDNLGSMALPIVLVMIVSGIFAILTGPWMLIANWDIYDAAFS